MTQELPPPPGPPPGWYPDPTTGTGYRYWDGERWTQQSAATAPAAAPGSAGRAGGPSLMPIGDWFSGMFRVAIDRAGHLFTMIVVLVVPTGLLNGMLVWYAFRGAVMTTDPDSGSIGFENPDASVGLYLLLAASSLLAALAGLVLTVAVARQAMAALDERSEPWSTSMAGAVRRMPRAIGVALVVVGIVIGLYLVMVVSAALVPPLLLLTLPAWLIGTLWIGVRLVLAPFSAALSPPGVASLGQGWSLSRSVFWSLFGRIILLGFVGVGMSLVAAVIAGPFTAIGGGTSDTPFDPTDDELRFGELLGDNPAVYAIGQLFGSIGNGAAVVLSAIGLTMVYRQLGGPVERDEQPAES